MAAAKAEAIVVKVVVVLVRFLEHTHTYTHIEFTCMHIKHSRTCTYRAPTHVRIERSIHAYIHI